MKTPTLRRTAEGSRGEPNEPRPARGEEGPGQGVPGAGGPPNRGDAPKDVDPTRPDGLGYIFEIAKNELDTQFKIAERLDSKARALFTLTAAIFAAAQALALRKDVLTSLSSGEHGTTVTAAIVAGVLVGLALFTTAWAMFVRKEKSVEAQPLFDWLNDLARSDRQEGKDADLEVARSATEAYITLMHRRREQNKGRAKRLVLLQVLCMFAITASLFELLVAVVSL
jgi:hypothetical protein